MQQESLSQQVFLGMRDMIIKEKSSGDQLPSERELMKMFNVSRTTVRQAMNRLELSGLISRVHGKGTFVSSQTVYSINLADEYSFTEHMKQLGIHPTSKILSLKKEKQEIDSQVGDFWKIKRIRLAGDKPELYEVTYLPMELIPELTIEELNNASLYGLIEDKFHIKLTTAHENCIAKLVNEKEAKYLNLNVGDPCLGLTRHSYDDQDRLIEFTNSTANSKDFSYKTVHVLKRE
ncbi:GntR family transcriptional regulator [Xylocopilactobacillus apis]|uniref:GntR family transcriptional regulator n=1 Tax=Xylocopilactobacillus apis TaxID=2932183 RepID=A0AAU9CS47_9LACO|nr:GntR family transcriptional regulator [Xylocopilactobacillus apis]BDR56774.1 GntR family transcriptional regulator [Xylocopilactobacillus apis]